DSRVDPQEQHVDDRALRPAPPDAEGKLPIVAPVGRDQHQDQAQQDAERVEEKPLAPHLPAQPPPLLQLSTLGLQVLWRKHRLTRPSDKKRRTAPPVHSGEALGNTRCITISLRASKDSGAISWPRSTWYPMVWSNARRPAWATPLSARARHG